MRLVWRAAIVFGCLGIALVIGHVVYDFAHGRSPDWTMQLSALSAAMLLITTSLMQGRREARAAQSS
jgi:hypothetical protein